MKGHFVLSAVGLKEQAEQLEYHLLQLFDSPCVGSFQRVLVHLPKGLSQARYDPVLRSLYREYGNNNSNKIQCTTRYSGIYPPPVMSVIKTKC